MNAQDSIEREGREPGDLTAVVAMTPRGVIGRDGDMPWRLSSDLRRFKRLTMGGVLIMGRRTFDSIGRPLPGRRTIVVSRNPGWFADGAERAASPVEALRLAGIGKQTQAGEVEKKGEWGDREGHNNPKIGQMEGRGRVFVVGGAEIYRQLLPQCTHLYLTRVLSDVEGDTNLEIDLSEFRLIEQTRYPATALDEVPTDFLRLIRRNS